MKVRMLALLVLLVSGAAFAKDTYVQGYTRKDGSYVQPHHRTSPDSNPYNNYSTTGNTNPYTGKAGTHDPNRNSGSSNRRTNTYQYNADSDSD
jgi:hypothetical protein